MKNSAFLLASLFFAIPFAAISQEKKAAGGDLLLTETTIGESVGYQYQSRVDGRLAQVFSNGGAVAMPNFNAFVVLPNLEKTGEKPIDSLPGNVEATFRLRFLVKNAITGRAIAAHDVNIRGMGRQKDEALVRALTGIRLVNPDMRWVADKIRQDIRDYFLVKSDSVLLDLQKLLANKRFGEAFVLANSAPEDAPKADEILKLKETAFNGYQEMLCPTLTGRVEAALASETPGRGMEILAALSPAAACAGEMKPRLSEIQPRIPEQVRGNYSWFFNAFSDVNGAKTSRTLTESAITREVLTGDGATMRFVKMRI